MSAVDGFVLLSLHEREGERDARQHGGATKVRSECAHEPPRLQSGFNEW